jgi:hypothetical protein
MLPTPFCKIYQVIEGMFVGKAKVFMGVQVMIEAVGHEIAFGQWLAGKAANAIYGEGFFGHITEFQGKGREYRRVGGVVFGGAMVFFTDWSYIWLTPEGFL